jgi:hypothetical protein
MRSSISGSNSAALVYAKALCGICAILVIALEVLSNYLLKQYSGTYLRVSRQYVEAVGSRPSNPGEPASVLMVGNSLLLAGVDLDRLQQLTATSLRIYPIFLEATSYYDWLYGLRRLFRDGARPQVVVVGLPVSSFLGNGVRHEYGPLMLFDAREVFDASSDSGLDRTAMSNLLLEHWSAFWDTRSILRAQILRHMIPHFEALFMLAKGQPTIPQGAEFDRIAISRAQRLRELCEAHGAKLILLIPPTPSSESVARQMATVSRKAGVETLVPISPAVLSTRYYESDETHLNSEGAAIFTSALATSLCKKIVTAEPVTVTGLESRLSLTWRND